MPTAPFTAREMTIRAALADGARYGIPSYQRPYAWPRELALQLLDDIVAAMQRGELSGPYGGSYFLGSVIVATPWHGGGEVGIVDGQQRLLTLTILLALLRDLDAGGPLAHDAGLAVADASGAVRIRPRAKDAEFFHRYVQAAGAARVEPPELGIARELAENDEADEAEEEIDAAEELEQGEAAEEAENGDEVADGADDVEEEPAEPDEAEAEEAGEEEAPLGLSQFLSVRVAPAHDSQHAMLGNRNALRQRLEELAATGRVRLAQLARFVLDNCYVILVRVPDNAEAHRVFTVMHTLGLDLLDTDILKSEVLGGIVDAGLVGAYQDKWEGIESDLGRDQFVRLFSHLRLIHLKRRQRKGTIDEIRDAFEPAAEPQRFVDGQVVPLGRALHVVRSGGYAMAGADPAHAAEINRRLRMLCILPNEGWVPAAMLLVHRFGQDAALLCRLLRRLDTLAYALFLMRPNDPSFEPFNRHVAVLKAIEASPDGAGLEASPLGLTHNETLELRRIIANGSYGSSLRRLIVVRRIDAELIPPGRPLPDYRGTNLEHVLPESPSEGSKWLDQFPAHGKHRQKLGNLIVLAERDNSRAGNREFDHKKAVYFAPDNISPFALKEELLTVDKWTPELVDSRSRRFEAMLVKLWELPESGSRRPASRPPPAPRGKKRSRKRQRKRPPHLGGR